MKRTVISEAGATQLEYAEPVFAEPVDRSLKTHEPSVTIYRWANKTRLVYLEFDEDGHVSIVHIGKPLKHGRPVYVKRLVRIVVPIAEKK